MLSPSASGAARARLVATVRPHDWAEGGLVPLDQAEEPGGELTT